MEEGSNMKYEVFSGTNIEDVKKEALETLGLDENKVIFVIDNYKKGLLKKENYQLKVYQITDIVEYVKDFITRLLSKMGVEVISLVDKSKDNQINITINSNKDALLIGKEGKNLKVLELVVKQNVYNLIGTYLYLILNVANYNERHEKYLQTLAKKIANEVKHTNQQVIMDNMNSYERRIIHNALANFKGVATISEGEEPNRHIIVKPSVEK